MFLGEVRYWTLCQLALSRRTRQVHSALWLFGIARERRAGGGKAIAAMVSRVKQQLNARLSTDGEQDRNAARASRKIAPRFSRNSHPSEYETLSMCAQSVCVCVCVCDCYVFFSAFVSSFIFLFFNQYSEVTSNTVE